MVVFSEEQHQLMHYGILRKSGRYPWGSGKDQNTRNRSYLDTIAKLKKEGMTEKQIADAHGITTTQLRAARSIARAQQQQDKVLTAQRLRDRGWSHQAIADRMGLPNESSVRALLAPGATVRADALLTTGNMLMDQVNKKKYVQVGKGVEAQLGVTRTHLDNAIAVAQEKGYTVHNIDVQQLGTGKYTTVKVLAPPKTTLSEVQKNRYQIQLISDHSEDHGQSFKGVQPPISISSRRVKVVYGNEGGKEQDGVIYVRPGVKDLSIGENRYGQVRIMVDKTHYLKGMAVYKEGLPPGTDLVFNTNKMNTGRKKDAFKPIEGDPDNPFGAITRQVYDEQGNMVSAMNIVGSPTKETSGVEGHWDTWSKNLPSQMLSKQSPDLAKQQLDLTYERRLKEYAEIQSLTNPQVKRDLLVKFGDETDSAAVHLQAASLPRQATKVLLPAPYMKPNEIYAPSMRDGEVVALVRFPHGGTFEIPQLKVNNRVPEARRTLGTAKNGRHDAVGVHQSVAERLSGADFDGDTVLVIPNNTGLVKSTPALEGLKGFDPMVYKRPKDSPIPKVDDDRKQAEMGKISNLITDMTIHGATTEELSRAIRHSMVVIDSEKHDLDFRASERDHGILQLKKEYQGGANRGATTLLSRAGAKTYIPERKERRASQGGRFDPKTGARVYEPTGRQRPVYKYVKDPQTGVKTKVKTGEFTDVIQRSKKLADTTDARTLIGPRDTLIENIYADHSNKLKALANDARKTSLSIQNTPQSKSAKKTYAAEVASLDAKLAIAKSNAPLEKQAQLVGQSIVSMKRQANPHMTPEDVKKEKIRALNEARVRTGAHKTRIDISQEEWNAIQAGAISNSKLEEILANADGNKVRQLALPDNRKKMTSTMTSRARTMLNDGYTEAEVADALGVGLTTLKVGLNE